VKKETTHRYKSIRHILLFSAAQGRQHDTKIN